MNYTCPVCGFPQLPDPPKNYEICPCCGTEFGLDDAEVTHTYLRHEWLHNRAPFFDIEIKPADWNPMRQLSKAGLLILTTEGPSSPIEYRVLDDPGQFEGNVATEMTA